ncbi:DUF6915 family protein [Solidesulfovibrio carbinolicus]|uniref:DUF6915 domain-containing protein n=1 Tax=Solidesulfovibrio carbinolicus TaxID=296842 RepID=A0A4P6HJA0_9BACT|nr:hypothetical protein [Solidesulfovibrio carbinolicus]QAZ67273.1 hypothetical protein C3Y92_08540 [Solidesulfovibrio carbinolicus]
MASFEQHCQETQNILGKRYEAVHKWLDEFFLVPPYGTRHRRLRHHEAGIREVERLFGLEAAKAARIHILMDLRMEGWRDGDPFPCDEAHFVDLGLW